MDKFSEKVVERFQPSIEFIDKSWHLRATFMSDAGKREDVRRGRIVCPEPFSGNRAQAVEHFDKMLRKVLNWTDCDFSF